MIVFSDIFPSKHSIYRTRLNVRSVCTGLVVWAAVVIKRTLCPVSVRVVAPGPTASLQLNTIRGLVVLARALAMCTV